MAFSPMLVCMMAVNFLSHSPLIHSWGTLQDWSGVLRSACCPSDQSMNALAMDFFHFFMSLLSSVLMPLKTGCASHFSRNSRHGRFRHLTAHSVSVLSRDFRLSLSFKPGWALINMADSQMCGTARRACMASRPPSEYPQIWGCLSWAAISEHSICPISVRLLGQHSRYFHRLRVRVVYPAVSSSFFTFSQSATLPRFPCSSQIMVLFDAIG